MKKLWLMSLTVATFLMLDSCNKSNNDEIIPIVMSGSVWKCVTGEIPNHRVQTLTFFDNNTGSNSDSLYYTYEQDSITHKCAEVRIEVFTYTHLINNGTIYKPSSTQTYVCLNDTTLSTNGTIFKRIN